MAYPEGPRLSSRVAHSHKRIRAVREYYQHKCCIQLRMAPYTVVIGPKVRGGGGDAHHYTCATSTSS